MPSMHLRLVPWSVALCSLVLLTSAGCEPADDATADAGAAGPAGPAPGEAVDSIDSIEASTFNLEEENGGVDDADEPELAAALDRDLGEGAVDDPADADDPDLRALLEEAGVQVYLVRILWGQLRGDRSIEAATDWSGEVSINAGGVQILRTIRFEARDHVVRPRENVRGFELVSHTRPHNDGLLLRVAALPTGANSLRIQLGETELTYTLDELDGLRDVVEVDDLGNRVAVQAVLRNPDEDEGGCQQGILAGRFRKVAGRDGGRFAGRWIAADGAPAGIIFGVYGERASGEQVIFGKYVSRDGTFRGRIVGTYEADGEGTGTFRARWIARDGESRGVLGGQYRAGERPRAGHFRGRWANNECMVDLDR